MFESESSPSCDAASLLAEFAAELEAQADRDELPPLSFVEFVRLVSPRYQWYRHCYELAAVLQQVADDELHKLMVFLPPRHSKSETISRLFSAYYLYRHPERFVGLTSYSANLAYTLSRLARDFFQAAGGRVRPDARGVAQWETPDRGGFWAAGVGGPITGKGFHLGIIDDPLKNAADAASEVLRTKQQEWYQSTFSTRAEPGAATIVVQTRWHEQDLAGWLLSSEENTDDAEPEGWTIIHLPAVAEDETPAYPVTCTVLPDWRQPGEALCPERYDEGKLARLRRRVGEFFWAALFQQRPRPRTGGMFKAGVVGFLDVAPAAVRARVRRWDIAATEDGGDYTAGLRMAALRDGRYLIEDVVRGRWASHTRDGIIRETAERDGRVIPVVVPQDPGAAGKDQAAAFIRLLSGFRVSAERESGDKVVRADPLASQWNAGNILLLRAPWNDAFLAEMTAFDKAAHDDQVDAAAGAFTRLAAVHTTTASPISLTRPSKYRGR